MLASQSEGGLYLTLVPPSYQPVPIPPVGQHNLFGPPCDSSVATGKRVPRMTSPSAAFP